MEKFDININGQNKTVSVDSDTPLLWVLRDELNLVGTKFGCGIAQCGACTVHINGKPFRSCSLPVSNVKDQEVTTIEGLSEKGNHPLQEAWRKLDVPQCGYCQAGQIMTAASLLDKNPNPSENEIDEAMHGNICRCTSYLKIKEAIKLAAK